MTVCVAALCENGKAAVMAADKLISMIYVEGEPNICKVRSLHLGWWVMIAGDDLAPAFDVIDYAKSELRTAHNLASGGPASLEAIKRAIQFGYEKKRSEDAEILYLRKIGWTLHKFNTAGRSILDNASQLQDAISKYTLAIELLIVGFDNGEGHILYLSGTGDKPGIAQRFDIPGFYAIGSGSTNALAIMYNRRLSPSTNGREAAYYVLEGKYYGEPASGVGPDTEMFIARPGEELKIIEDSRIEKVLIPICRSLEPRDLTEKHRKSLNDMPELEWFGPATPPPKPEKKRKIPNPEGQSDPQ